MTKSYDYIVVGGGSAGCIIAAQLSEKSDRSVLVLEYGDRAENNPETLRADGYKDAFANDRVMWERFSVPQPGCKDRRLFMGSGRGMGGSGSVNGMVYLRGGAPDFEQWGVKNWYWTDIEEDFRALEKHLTPNRRPPTDLTERCIAAAVASGFGHKEDLNDGDINGFLGYEWMNYAGNDRRSSYVAFLKPHWDRPNLTVEIRARAHRVIFDSRRAVGVEYEVDGEIYTVKANREILLCSGALETPKLLMLSGVGPKDHLTSMGIEVVHDLPAVGENFHDHPNVTLFFKGQRDVDFTYPQLYGFHRVNAGSGYPKKVADTCFVFYPARSSLNEAMVRLLPGMVLPKKLYDSKATQWLRSSIKLGFKSKKVQEIVNKIYGIVVILGKPKSRGTLRLKSTNIGDDALIDPAYLAQREDMDTLLKGIDLARKIASQSSLAEFGNDEIFPGRLAPNRDKLESWVRQNIMTTYHFAGTCRMGDDQGSVVDGELKVRGIDNLRIADASVIPLTPVSALNAPSMLIGYRAAKFINARPQA